MIYAPSYRLSFPAAPNVTYSLILDIARELKNILPSLLWYTFTLQSPMFRRRHWGVPTKYIPFPDSIENRRSRVYIVAVYTLYINIYIHIYKLLNIHRNMVHADKTRFGNYWTCFTPVV